MAYLTLSLKDRVMSRHAITGNLRIGRDPANDVVIDNVGVSRHHASILVKNERTFSVKDAGSQNGVFVNGRRVDERELVDGDVIQIGKYTLEYRAGELAGMAKFVQNEARPAGEGRGKLKTFALSDEQLQEVLVKSKAGGGIKVPNAVAQPGPAAATPRVAVTAPATVAVAAPAAAPAIVAPAPPQMNAPGRPDVSTQNSYAGYVPPEPAFVDRPQALIGAPPAQHMVAPVIWVALGLTVLVVIVGIVIL